MEHGAWERSKRTTLSLALLGGLALSACSQPERHRYSDGGVPTVAGCDNLPTSEPIQPGQMRPGEDEIKDENPKNPINHKDLAHFDLIKTNEQLRNFSYVDSHYMASTGITFSLFSNGELEYQLEQLETVFMAPFELEYSGSRLQATMECLNERFLAHEFAGHEIPIYISADPRECIQHLQLKPRSVTADNQPGVCHATGGSVPVSIRELSRVQSVMERFITLERGVHPIFIAIGATALSDYESDPGAVTGSVPPYTRNPDRNLNNTLRHELYHTQRWMAGAKYSITNWAAEENLVRHLERSTVTYIDEHLDGLPVNYTTEALSDWHDKAVPGD